MMMVIVYVMGSGGSVSGLVIVWVVGANDSVCGLVVAWAVGWVVWVGGGSGGGCGSSKQCFSFLTSLPSSRKLKCKPLHFLHSFDKL